MEEETTKLQLLIPDLFFYHQCDDDIRNLE